VSGVRLVPEHEDGPERAEQRRNGAPPGDDGDEDEGSRHVTNMILGLAVVAVIAIGIWLVNALLEQRRIDNCVAQGRRNCGQVEVPTR
jgi:hypothetical protein